MITEFLTLYPVIYSYTSVRQMLKRPQEIQPDGSGGTWETSEEKQQQRSKYIFQILINYYLGTVLSAFHRAPVIPTSTVVTEIIKLILQRKKQAQVSTWPMCHKASKMANRDLTPNPPNPQPVLFCFMLPLGTPSLQ